MTNLEIEHITTILMIKWALIFYIFVVIFRAWAQNRTLKRIKVILKEGEEIIYHIQFLFSIDVIVPLVVGGFFGGCILPFYLYPDIQNIMSINRSNLPIWCFCEIICILAVLVFSCKKNVLTNSRLLNQWTFEKLNILGKDPTSSSALFKNTNLNYSDISSIKSRKSYWRKLIDIHTKDNKYLYLAVCKNIEKIKTIIDEQINKNKELIKGE